MKIEYEYKGQIVEFDLLGPEEVEVNATEMGRVFGKRPVDFLKLAGTKAFIEEMGKPFPAKRSDLKSLRFAGNADFADEPEDRSDDLKPLYRSETGGDDGGGTWMSEVLALKFAAWLDVRFEVWVYRTIRTILRGGGAPLAVQEHALMRQEAALQAEEVALRKQLADHPLQQKLNQVEAQRKQVRRARTKLVKGQLDIFVAEATGELPRVQG